jgi:CDP-glucose 4,6-dehydratase
MYLFWKDKRVLLTGHTGFKGTWLSMILEHLGAVICGFSLSEKDNPFYIKAAPKLDKKIKGDIRDKKNVERIIKEFQPEIVIHFASHSTLNKGCEITHYIFETNTMGVVNLLEAVRTTPSVKAVLIVTSDKSYKNFETSVPYTEDSILGAQDPYSTSKACQELITECYRQSFFLKDGNNVRIATARASNVIGGGDYNITRLLPSLLNSYIVGETAIIRNPNAIRPWQNVLDVLIGYLMLCKKLYEEDAKNEIVCSAFNFGPEEDGFVTVEEVAKTLAKQFINGSYSIEDNGVLAVKETQILKLDSTKAKKILGWYPKYSFYETICMTAEFTKRQFTGENVRDICLDMIDKFLEE